MNLDPDTMKELIGIFQVELEQQSQAITDCLLELEKEPGMEAAVKLYNTMFRAAHNIKGAARGVGFMNIADIAHKLESLFNSFTGGNTHLTHELVDVSLQCLDFMRSAGTGEQDESVISMQSDELVKRIERLVSEAPGDNKVGPVSCDHGDDSVQMDNGEGDWSETSKTLQDQSGQAAKTPANIPEESGARAINIPVFRMDQVAAFIEELQITRAAVENHHVRLNDLGQRVDQVITGLNGIKQMLRRLDGAVPEELHSTLNNNIDSTKELQNDVFRLQRTTRTDANKLNAITDALQDNLHMMRLVPAGNLLRPLMRSVRDIARELDKQVDFSVSGTDIGMDQPILDSLRDPLLHLLRNAVDHGIETGKERLARGKPATGRISLAVERSGNEINILVADDGAGIDINEIKKTAVAKGILKPDEADSRPENEIVDLIFNPGFSTKPIVTNVSGRGIGLDVVRTNLQRLKGNVSVETAIDEGTVFRFRVPLTLTTERGLLVRTGSRIFAIPNTSINRTLNIKSGDLFELEANLAVTIDDKPVPVRDLSDLLQLDYKISTTGKEFHLVVISSGWYQIALLVDEVMDERDIVIKHLPPPLYSVPNIAGACMLGNGNTVIILNPADLIQSALTGSGKPGIQDTAEETKTETKQILVVDDSITTRTLVRNILEAQGFDVATAVDGKEGWEVLQARPFDLVVTDIQMPVIDGFEFTSMIKNEDKYRNLPVIIVTSLASETDKKRGIEVGADAYIVKGDFETRALLDVINQFL